MSTWSSGKKEGFHINIVKAESKILYAKAERRKIIFFAETYEERTGISDMHSFCKYTQAGTIPMALSKQNRPA